MLYIANMSVHDYDDYTEFFIVKDFSTSEELALFLRTYSLAAERYADVLIEDSEFLNGPEWKRVLASKVKEDLAAFSTKRRELFYERKVHAEHVVIDGVYIRLNEYVQTMTVCHRDGTFTHTKNITMPHFVTVDEYIKSITQPFDTDETLAEKIEMFKTYHPGMF